jgi:hypothetical protein
MMNRFKPYFVSSLIGEQLMSCKETNGMEGMIMQEVKPLKKNIRGLETTEFQASIFDSIPYLKQAKDLVSYIDSVDHYKEITEQMVKVYLMQDLAQLDKLMQQSDVGMNEYMDLMLYDRNRRWVNQIPGIMKEGTDGIPLQRGIRTAREDGATVIWCHNTFGHEDIPNWVSGLLHAQNIFDGGDHGTYEDTFYRYLNVGMKVPFSTGTDWFIYDFSRVYLPISGARIRKLFNAQTKFEADRVAASGFKPPVPLRDGIARMVQWYVKEGRHQSAEWHLPPAEAPRMQAPTAARA